MKTKAFSSPMALAAAVLVVMAASGARTASAAAAGVNSTCAAAAAADSRVDVPFCISQLAASPGAAAADELGLAEIASLIGVNLSGAAVRGMSNGTAGAAGAAGARGRRSAGGTRGTMAMDGCSRAYGDIGMLFSRAFAELGAGRLTAATRAMERVGPLAQRCDSMLSRASSTSPLPMYSSDTQRMAIIGTAITNLLQ